MKRFLLTLQLFVLTTCLSAQTFREGYYLLQVVRSGGTVHADKGMLWQDQDYTIPTAYTLGDLPYIFKFEDAGGGAFTIMNCKSLEYIVLPATENQLSVQLYCGPSDPALFSPVATGDGKFWGFCTMAHFVFGGKEYDLPSYLNDFQNTNPYSLCLWYDGPDRDTGSCLTVVEVDADTVEQLMGDTTPDKQDMVTFMPEKGSTYTVYSANTRGYMAGHGDVKGAVAQECEYAFEQAGTTDDFLPTFYIKQSLTGQYLQAVDLTGKDDSSDLQAGLPHGDKATAATFTVLRAVAGCDDARALSDHFNDGDYVICCTQPKVEGGMEIPIYVESFSGAMYYGPYIDSGCNAFRISKYVSKEVTPPTVVFEDTDDQSVELWGAATDTLAVRTADGLLIMIPDNMIEGTSTEGGLTTVTLKGDTAVTGRLVACPTIDADFPKFRTFKFNNKYNDILFVDANGEVSDNEITIDVASCIGKTLCPSFSLTDEAANVYYRNRRQLSHQNRNRFDKVLTYTVALPGQRILQVVKTRDEEWSQPTVAGEETLVALTPDQLSTNAPSNYEATEGLHALIDGNLDNYFHSTWGQGAYQPLTYNRNNPSRTEWPYVDIALDEPLRHIKWGYTTQSYGSSRIPGAISLLASNDGDTWTEVAALDDLPKGFGVTYTTEAIDMGRDYAFLRVLLTAADYKNYLCMAEMYLYKIETETSGNTEPELLHEAEYHYTTRPWGRDVQVKATFAADLTPDVPRIDINLDDGATLLDIHYNKTTYFKGRITIDGVGVFPDMPETEVNMRGRGNSSWSASKKPYRLKFNTKVKPFGLTKGKSWCLIAQAQTGSMLTNPIAQRVATMTGTVGANHCIPVELYVNGAYLGSYMFTENPGFANNSVDIDETNAYMLELDSYYDEAYKFRDNYYDLPVNIKEPDLTEMLDYQQAIDTYSLIQDQFDDFTSAVYYRQAETVEAKTDIDSWSRFMLVNDVVRNTELMHPKSTKLFRVDMTDDEGKYVWGPVWDFDWAFGYENGHTYYINRAETDLYESIGYNNTGGSQGRFFGEMLNGSEALKADRYRVWTEFMQSWRDELLDYVDDYLAFAQTSFEHNSTKWSDGKNYATNAANAKTWLKTRTDWVYANMPAYDLPERTFGIGDVNEDGRVSVGDAICVVNAILGLPNDCFNRANADMNGDGQITVGDLQLIIRAILDAENTSAAARAQMPRCEATLTVEPFATTAGAEAEVKVNMATEEPTAGLQMDIVLPDGATLTNVRTADALAPFRTRIASLGGSRYRVLVVAQDGQRIAPTDMNNMTLDITMGEMPARKTDRVVRLANVILSTPEGTDMAAQGAHGMFAEATGIDAVSADELTVRGGDDLRIECVKDGSVNVYSLSGALVTTVRVARGTTTVNLPMGIYIVNGYKVTID